jgi:guanylate kinase
MSRDNATREQVMARIKNQMPDEKIAEYCKYQIINENLDDVHPQVEKIIMAEKKN